MSALKLVFILRGPSGVGKSTLAKNPTSLLDMGPSGFFLNYETTICSADDHFVGIDGKYVFDPTKLHEAHALCKQKFIDALVTKSEKIGLVIVDNTNLRFWDWRYYYDQAGVYGALPIVVNVRPPSGEFFNRGIHGVPEQRWREQVRLYEEEKVPSSYLQKVVYTT